MVATPYDPFLRTEGLSAINGPASVNATLLDTVTSANYEGVWLPWLFVKQGSLEISGVFTGLSCQLYGTNAQSPLNSYAVTITGTVLNSGDVVTLTFTTPLGVLTAAYTLGAAATLTTVAAGLAAIINTTLAFAQAGFMAFSLAGVLTVTWLSVVPLTGQFTFSTSSPGVIQNVIVGSSVTGSGNEAVAVAPGSGGSALGTAITAAGMTQFTFSSRWLKVRITSLSSGSVTAIAQGTA